jgi:RNA 2',3'-cyclic 3'-phosphodiesterase
MPRTLLARSLSLVWPAITVVGVRMFVAVIPPVVAVEHLDDFLEVRREAGPFRWTLPEHFHLTLAFLEDVADHQVDELSERLGAAAARRVPMTVSLSGGGAFPHVGQARVLWAGLQGETELGRLATGARLAAARSGVVVDGQRFRPHLTIARLSRPVEASRWVKLLGSYAGPAWELTEVELVASYLGEGPRRRPRYETVATFPLG